MRETGGVDPQSAFLRVVLVGPAHPARGLGARHTARLAPVLVEAGHEVTLLTWGAGDHRAGRPGPAAWWRTSRRLLAADAVVVVPGGPGTVAPLVALLRGLRLRARTRPVPPVVLVAAEPLPPAERGPLARVTAPLVRHCDAVLVHDEGAADAARALGAQRVSVTPWPDLVPVAPGASGAVARATRRRVTVGAGRRTALAAPLPGAPAAPVAAPDLLDGEPGLPGDWARYVGAIEALVAPLPSAVSGPPSGGGWGEPDDDGRDATGDREGAVEHGPARGRAADRLASGRRAVRRWLRARRDVRALAARDLPEWLAPTDVLLDADVADDARALARHLGLPRADPIATWAALGALGAVVRLVDDGRRTAVVVDEGGEGTAFGRLARTAGYEPVHLRGGAGAGGGEDGGAGDGDDGVELDLDALDVLVRLHPDGCDADDVDETVGRAAWALRHGGVLVVTVPLALPGVAGGLTPADLRGLVARASEAGLALVGDLDGPLALHVAAAARGAAAHPRGERAYGLARLTFRRG